MTSGAAFFDLDKTLMEGSSAIHFGRAAYRAGLMSRRQLASDAWANIQFRLRGSTDETTKALWNRILDSIAGKRVTDLARLGPQILSGAVRAEQWRYALAHASSSLRCGPALMLSP